MTIAEVTESLVSYRKGDALRQLKTIDLNSRRMFSFLSPPLLPISQTFNVFAVYSTLRSTTRSSSPSSKVKAKCCHSQRGENTAKKKHRIFTSVTVTSDNALPSVRPSVCLGRFLCFPRPVFEDDTQNGKIM